MAEHRGRHLAEQQVVHGDEMAAHVDEDPPPDSAFFQNHGECGPKWASRPRIQSGLPMVPAATMSMISRKSGA